MVQGLSFALLAGVLAYLYRVTSHRHERLPAVALVLGVAGPILFGVAGVLLDISRVGLADDFLREMTGYTPPLFAEADAENLLEERDGVAVALGAGGTLGLAFSMVLLNLNAMRVGLLGRFLGVIGIITGALYVIPVFTGPAILQLFWLGSLVALFLDRWPGGRGPAWDSGEAAPWPSAAERRGLTPASRREDEADASEAGGVRGNGEDPGAGPEAGDTVSARPRKRKRKRRR